MAPILLTCCFLEQAKRMQLAGASSASQKDASLGDSNALLHCPTDDFCQTEVDFYARYLLDAANGDDQDTGDAASLDQAVRDGNDTGALLTPAYTFLETVAKSSDNYDFAQHASLVHGKLSMASVCSTPCAAER